MRISQQQIAVINQTVAELIGSQAVVYLFGSRLNEQAKGGDIDLLIESNQPISLLQRAQIKVKLESSLGLPIDIVSRCFAEAPSAFQRIAKSKAQRLNLK